VTLEEKLKLLPDKPGVYIMKNDKGTVIYVGKARSLKSRVRSYFQNSKHHGAKVKALVAHIVDLEYIITDSEIEALIFECNLIKKHRPKYNINLKDDKHYPYLKVTLNESFPRVMITRSIKKDGAKYFGPYTSSGAVQETLKLLRSIFPLRSCSRKDFDGRDRACLNLHIKRCLAPCSGHVVSDTYKEIINEVILFLDGKQEDLIKNLTKQMEIAAENLEFEKAAQLRNQVQAVQKVVEKQKIISSELEDQDIIAFASKFDLTCVHIFFVRKGKLIGREHHFLEGTAEMSEGEILAAFAKQHYSVVEFVPKEILLHTEMDDSEVVAEWLKGKRGSKVHLKVPQRGEKLKLVEMVGKNAQMELDNHLQEADRQREMTEGALDELQRELGLEELPNRIECYDISNTQGTESVGSMVVFEGGKPKNSDYRRFKIKTVQGPNDFASMQEVLFRRFKNAKEETKQIAEGTLQKSHAKFHRLPDLVIIDGGKGQLSSAREIMKGNGFGYISTYGLAKEFEHLFKEGSSEPIILPRNSKALYLIQRIRDEAHRFAIEYHRNLRAKRNMKSILEDIPGVGQKRKKALLVHFGSLAKVKQASVEELMEVDGMNEKVALEVYEFLQRV